MTLQLPYLGTYQVTSNMISKVLKNTQIKNQKKNQTTTTTKHAKIYKNSIPFL
jgi:hypothetical protein